MIKILYITKRIQYCHFFQEKKWGPNEKVDKNKCPFFCPRIGNHFLENVKNGVTA